MQISFPCSPRFQVFVFLWEPTIILILFLQNKRQMCLAAVWRRAREENRALSRGSLCHHQQSPAGLSVSARASSVNNSLSVSGVAPLACSIHLQFKKKPGSVKGGE